MSGTLVITISQRDVKFVVQLLLIIIKISVNYVKHVTNMCDMIFLYVYEKYHFYITDKNEIVE